MNVRRYIRKTERLGQKRWDGKIIWKEELFQARWAREKTPTEAIKIVSERIARLGKDTRAARHVMLTTGGEIIK